MNKQILIKNFSRYAGVYDQYADVQGLCGLKLLEQINTNGFKDILELGCGTGNYTRLLKDKFSKARLKAVDISERMIQVAQDKLKDREVEFVIGDAENINLKEEFDLLTANACFQWFDDLDKALARCRALLKDNGIISFSVFGPETFRELRESLGVLFKDAPITAAGFADKDKIEGALKRNFKKVKIVRAIHQESLPRLKDLLDKIKYTGTKGSGLNGKVSFSPRLLTKLEEVYMSKFGKIVATYEIYFCQGRNSK